MMDCILQEETSPGRSIINGQTMQVQDSFWFELATLHLLHSPGNTLPDRYAVRFFVLEDRCHVADRFQEDSRVTLVSSLLLTLRRLPDRSLAFSDDFITLAGQGFDTERRHLIGKNMLLITVRTGTRIFPAILSG
jgi:hypothetical protein